MTRLPPTKASPSSTRASSTASPSTFAAWPHTNGVESFWSMLKRAHKGVFHKMSPKHLDRYVQEFAGKHNIRDMNTAAQMAVVAAGLSREASDVQEPYRR